MRASAAATVLLLLLAGCAAPDEDEEDPLFGICPQWLHGPGGQTTGFRLAANGTGNATDNATVQETELGPAAEEHQGHPLDLYRITLTKLEVDGRLQLRAFDGDGKQLLVRDYRKETPQQVPVVVFTDGDAVDHEFEVFLGDVTGDDAGSPSPVTLRWTLDGAAAEVGFDATFHYKVCGAKA